MNQEPNEGGALSLRSVMGFLSDTWNSLNPKKKKNDTKISLDTKTRISKIFELLLKQQKQDLW